MIPVVGWLVVVWLVVVWLVVVSILGGVPLNTRPSIKTQAWITLGLEVVQAFVFLLSCSCCTSMTNTRSMCRCFNVFDVFFNVFSRVLMYIMFYVPHVFSILAGGCHGRGPRGGRHCLDGTRSRGHH